VNCFHFLAAVFVHVGPATAQLRTRNGVSFHISRVRAQCYGSYMFRTEYATQQYKCAIQNRRQKVFNRGALQLCGGLCFCGGLTFQKLTKTPLIYSVSSFNLGSLELCLGGLSPPKPPVATWLVRLHLVVL